MDWESVSDKHYRETSDDGKRSYLREHTMNPLSNGRLVEVSEHHDDGETVSRKPSWDEF